MTYAPVRVLHVFGRMNRGGAELRTLDLVRSLSPEQYQSHFCVLTGLPGVLDEEIRTYGGTVHYCKLNSLAFVPRFLRVLRQQKIDVVQSNVLFASGFLLMLAAMAGVRVRISYFHSANDGHRSTSVRRLIKAVLRNLITIFSTHVIAVSRAAMESNWGIHWERDVRRQVIYNGFPTGAWSDSRLEVRTEFGLPTDAKLVVHVGNMRTPKNHGRIISVFSRFVNQHPEAVLLLVGEEDPDIAAALQAQVKEYGIQNNVLFAGTRTDVDRILTASDVFLFPSLWEGLPSVVVESIRSGTPVVASDLPVISEIAEQLPLVFAVSLQASDEAWREVLESAVQQGRSTARETAKRAFENSPFTISATKSHITALWQRRTTMQAASSTLLPEIRA